MLIVFEKAKELRSMGSPMTLNVVMHLWEQLSLRDELWSISKLFAAINIRCQDMSCKGSFQSHHPGVDIKKMFGEDTPILTRLDLISLLLSHIPKEKIHYHKRITRIEESSKQATIFCQDDTSYSGTLIVGADGAYSSARRHMNARMEEEGTLPEMDSVPSAITTTALLESLNPWTLSSTPLLKKQVL
ncbi:hypothetical protein BGZ47_003847 [Haplosporangium gracile]|nr:hypothetical protein BGZ47_003847 [Haplosporangium gracile]